MENFEEFKFLKAQWELETSHLSTYHHILKNEHFKKILLFPNAIELILNDLLKTDCSSIFMGLHELTKENPVPVEHAGRVKLQCKDWILWGRDKGYIKFDEKDERIWELEGGIEKAITTMHFLYNCLETPGWKHAYPDQTLKSIEKLEKLSGRYYQPSPLEILAKTKKS